LQRCNFEAFVGRGQELQEHWYQVVELLGIEFLGSVFKDFSNRRPTW